MLGLRFTGGQMVKTANPLDGKPIAIDTERLRSALSVAAAAKAKEDALLTAGRAGLTALGIGAGARGIAGMYNAVTRPRRKVKTNTSHNLLAFPYPVEKQSVVKDLLAGNMATKADGVPWMLPAAMTASIAGMGLGWKGVDKILNSRRKAERKQDLDDARQRFHDALLSQYNEPVKLAQDATPSLGKILDAIYDNFEKSATIPDTIGSGLGMYGALAAPAALLAGAVVYDRTKKRQRASVLDKALKERERQRFRSSPPPILAIPEPVERDHAPKNG